MFRWLTYSIIKYWQLFTYGFKFTCKWNFFLRVLHIVKWTNNPKGGLRSFFLCFQLPYHLWNNPAIVQMITMIVDKLITWIMKSLRVLERESMEENGIFLLSIKRKLKTELSLQSDPFKKLRNAVRFVFVNSNNWTTRLMVAKIRLPTPVLKNLHTLFAWKILYPVGFLRLITTLSFPCSFDHTTYKIPNPHPSFFCWDTLLIGWWALRELHYITN